MLNILDGVPERTGQVIMMSANKPEEIDPALLRPGRIDILLEFKAASQDSLIKMIQHQFQLFDPLELKVLDQNTKLLDRKWTPAEIFQICSKYPSNKRGFQLALQQLITSDPDSLRNPF